MFKLSRYVLDFYVVKKDYSTKIVKGLVTRELHPLDLMIRSCRDTLTSICNSDSDFLFVGGCKDIKQLR